MSIQVPNKFPHILPQDAELMRRYITSISEIAVTVDYDVRVGLGREAPAHVPRPIQKMAIEISQRRIDAVVTLPGQIIIAEISSLAGFTSIGQTLGYPVLYARSYFPALPVSGLLVTEQLQTDMEIVLTTLKVPFILLPG